MHPVSFPWMGRVMGFPPPLAAIRSVQLPQNEQFLVADSMWINTGEVGIMGKVFGTTIFLGEKITHLSLPNTSFLDVNFRGSNYRSSQGMTGGFWAKTGVHRLSKAVILGKTMIVLVDVTYCSIILMYSCQDTNVTMTTTWRAIPELVSG